MVDHLVDYKFWTMPIADAVLKYGIFGACRMIKETFVDYLKARDEYSWAATYHAGSDCFIYRRFKGELPEHARPYAKDPPMGVVMFCDRENVDVCIDDELTGGPRKVRLGTAEAP